MQDLKENFRQLHARPRSMGEGMINERKKKPIIFLFCCFHFNTHKHKLWNTSLEWNLPYEIDITLRQIAVSSSKFHSESCQVHRLEATSPLLNSSFAFCLTDNPRSWCLNEWDHAAHCCHPKVTHEGSHMRKKLLPFRSLLKE